MVRVDQWLPLNTVLGVVAWRVKYSSCFSRQFPQVIEKMYMSQKDILFKIEIHRVLSEYFENKYGERDSVAAVSSDAGHGSTGGAEEKRSVAKEIILKVQRDRQVGFLRGNT